MLSALATEQSLGAVDLIIAQIQRGLADRQGLRVHDEGVPEQIGNAIGGLRETHHEAQSSALHDQALQWSPESAQPCRLVASVPKRRRNGS